MKLPLQTRTLLAILASAIALLGQVDVRVICGTWTPRGA
jgi:hypothetical protein